ncbi:MAG: YifB family Mg chelatase-like AAA ATPase [Planctomycetota bacterium]
MLARVRSFLQQGIEPRVCDVEVDLSPGLPKTTVVGLPDAAVKESVERVRSAVVNSGYPFPAARLLINLAPADLRKEGPVYDLPIAIGLLMASRTDGLTPAALWDDPANPAGPLEARPPTATDPASADRATPHAAPPQCLIAGELALDGQVRPIHGAINLAVLAKRTGVPAVLVPQENAEEANAVGGVRVHPVARLLDAVLHLTGDKPIAPLPPVAANAPVETAPAEVDFAEVRGQQAVKRALVIAAAGMHNILMIGPAGSGKSLCAKALPGILPPMARQEALEVTRIWSAAGKGPHRSALVRQRPVRSPHHTASSAAVIGGGINPRPGEVSLAHHGVLFLDEMPEFPRAVLETLRQPLEDGVVTIARAQATVRLPARFLLVGALNPTPRGDMPADGYGQKQMQRYLERLSGPLIDRVDLHVEVSAVPYEKLSGKPDGTSTADMRAQVAQGRAVQAKRNPPEAPADHRPGQPGETAEAITEPQGKPNSRLRGKELDRLAPLDAPAQALLKQAVTELGLSARAYDKVRRVSRTIADLAGREHITAGDVAEAVSYRLLDRTL